MEANLLSQMENKRCASSSVGQLIEDNQNSYLRDNRKGNRHMEHKPDYDNDHRFELFLLDDGQKKVEWKDETRMYHPTHTLPQLPIQPPSVLNIN